MIKEKKNHLNRSAKAIANQNRVIILLINSNFKSCSISINILFGDYALNVERYARSGWLSCMCDLVGNLGKKFL